VTELNQRKCPNCGSLNLCQNLTKMTAQSRLKVTEYASSCWCMSVKLTTKQREKISEFENLACCLCSQCIDSFK